MANDMLKKALREAAMEEYFDISCETVNWEPSERFCSETEPVVKKTSSRARTAVKRILPIAAVILLLASTALFSVADVRNKVINYFVSHHEDHIDLYYGIDEPGDIFVEGAIDEILTLDLEERGFELKEQNVTDHSSVTVWEKGEDFIILQQGDGLTSRSVDSARLERSTVVSMGVTFDIYSEEGYYLLLWTTDKYTFSLDCYCSIPPEDLIETIVGANEEETREAQ